MRRLTKIFRRRHPVPTPEATSFTVDSTDPGNQTWSDTALAHPLTSINHTNASLDSSPLRPTTDTQLGDSRFRVLVVGKSGVGKSSLINAVFGVNLTRTSDDKATDHDIDEELASDANQRLILHDSQGFVGGDIKNLQTVQKFIKKRSEERELKDRLHAIWLCCEIPFAGGRVFERGDEILLRDDTNQVPIIVVFTKYDQLVIRKKGDLARTLGKNIVGWERQAEEAAMAAVKSSCEKPLNAVAGNRHTWTEVSTTIEYKNTIEKLIDLTKNSRKNTDDDLEGWLFAFAQRHSLGTKISTSIDVGRRQYWDCMFSGSLTGHRLDEWVRVIHDDIANSWNFNDPNHQCLKSTEFRALMTHLVKDLASDRPNPLGLVDTAIKVVGPAAAMIGALPPSAPIVLPLAMTVALAGWVYEMYQRTSEVLRYLMGYVIDMIIVMSCLFALVESRGLGRRLDSRGLDQISPAMVNLVLREYSRRKGRVHEEVNSYVNNTALSALQPKRAIGRISELVKAEQHKDLHAAVILAASRSLDDGETWMTPDI